ncbi:unnamed protein product [Aphanomyces euteiches]
MNPHTSLSMKNYTSHTIDDRRRALELLQTLSTYQVAKEMAISRRTIRNWAANSEAILEFKGSKMRKKMKSVGRKEILPDPTALKEYMTEMRAKERALTCVHVIKWLKKHHRDWLRVYLSGKNNGYKSLLRLLQRFSHRHGFSRQRPGKLKLKQDVLDSMREEFAKEFHRQYETYDKNNRYNVDETGEKNAYRMTAVLTIRGDGKKLPILFIIRGKPGGRIDMNELPTFPEGHFYAVQEKA